MAAKEARVQICNQLLHANLYILPLKFSIFAIYFITPLTNNTGRRPRTSSSFTTPLQSAAEWLGIYNDLFNSFVEWGAREQELVTAVL